MTIAKEYVRALEELCREFALSFIVLHGSRATGKERRGSDLDLAYMPKGAISFNDQMALYGKLATVSGDTPDRELDVKSLRGTDPLFMYEVARDSVFLAGDRSAYEEFRNSAFVRYHDSKDLRDLEQQLLRKSIQRLARGHAQ